MAVEALSLADLESVAVQTAEAPAPRAPDRAGLMLRHELPRSVVWWLWSWPALGTVALGSWWVR